MNYIEGNRGYWQSPNKLLFYALVVWGLHVLWVDQEVLNLSFDVEGVNPSWFFLGLVLPFLVLSSWLLFGVKRVKLAHQLVAASYFWSVWFIVFTVLGDLIDLVVERHWPMLDIVFFLLFASWSQARVWKSHWAWWKQVLMAKLQVLLFFGLLAAFLGLIYLAGGRVKTIEGNTPDNQEQIR